MYVEVLKSFPSGDRVLQTGEIVDASGWRFLRQMIDQRYVRTASAPSKSAKEKSNA